LDSKEELYKQNYKKLLRVACKMLPDGQYANDIIHDVFIEFIEKCNGSKPVRCPKSWLYRVTLNKCVDRVRNNKKIGRIEEIGEIISTDDSIENNEKKAIVGRALANLKMKERELAVLYSEGLSYKEIAEITEINPASIGKMLSRTLKKLELELKKLGYELHG